MFFFSVSDEEFAGCEQMREGILQCGDNGGWFCRSETLFGCSWTKTSSFSWKYLEVICFQLSRNLGYVLFLFSISLDMPFVISHFDLEKQRWSVDTLFFFSHDVLYFLSHDVLYFFSQRSVISLTRNSVF